MRKVRSAKSVKRRKAARARRPRARADATEVALAMLAHEIRTPLNGILALSELIATGDVPERERQWASLVKGGAEHLAQLATLVIDGVRAGRGRLALRAEPFRLRALAEAVGATLKARAEAKGLVAHVTIAEDLPELVRGDRVRLRAALENIVDNAVKFTEAGRITLAVEARAMRSRHRLTFTVTDTGIGVSAAELARLFRPFRQANAKVARRYGGSGLGLAFVRRLAAEMDGDLKVTSQPGRGSTFRLTVTVGRAEEGERVDAGRTDAAPRANGARGLRILCAEDNPYARVVLNTILTELGHRIDFAGSGLAAVAAVDGGGYDGVLMDVTLPVMDGLAATRAIRALSGSAARTPVIGISGRTDARDEEAALAAGMNAFMAKPVSPAALAALLASLGVGRDRV